MTISVQFSHSVVSVFLWPHGLQHTRLPCPSPTSGACSNSCPLSRWYLPTISTSVVPFSSRLQSFPASGSFPMYQFFTSGGQSMGDSASAWSFQEIFRTDFLQDWLVGSLVVQGTLKSLLQLHSTKASNLQCSAFLMVQLSHPFPCGFPCGSAGKESTCNAGDLSSTPGLWRSSGEGKAYLLQYSGLENSMDCVSMGLQRVGHDQVTITHIHTWLLEK